MFVVLGVRARMSFGFFIDGSKRKAKRAQVPLSFKNFCNAREHISTYKHITINKVRYLDVPHSTA